LSKNDASEKCWKTPKTQVPDEQIPRIICEELFHPAPASIENAAVAENGRILTLPPTPSTLPKGRGLVYALLCILFASNVVGCHRTWEAAAGIQDRRRELPRSNTFIWSPVLVTGFE
jgi:hypothetical protein